VLLRARLVSRGYPGSAPGSAVSAKWDGMSVPFGMSCQYAGADPFSLLLTPFCASNPRSGPGFRSSMLLPFRHFAAAPGQRPRAVIIFSRTTLKPFDFSPHSVSGGRERHWGCAAQRVSLLRQACCMAAMCLATRRVGHPSSLHPLHVHHVLQEEEYFSSYYLRSRRPTFPGFPNRRRFVRVRRGRFQKEC
jgi:hypothetical protein